MIRPPDSRAIWILLVGFHPVVLSKQLRLGIIFYLAVIWVFFTGLPENAAKWKIGICIEGGPEFQPVLARLIE